MLSEYDKANIERIVAGDGDWFTADLLRLISKSDMKHRELIRKGFPDEVAAYEKWYNGEKITQESTLGPDDPCDDPCGRHEGDCDGYCDHDDRHQNACWTIVNDEYKDGWYATERFD